jgi:hypothetical protein
MADGGRSGGSGGQGCRWEAVAAEGGSSRERVFGTKTSPGRLVSPWPNGQHEVKDILGVVYCNQDEKTSSMVHSIH